MIDTTPFSIFARKPAPSPITDAAPPDPVPAAEPLRETPPPAQERVASEDNRTTEVVHVLIETEAGETDAGGPLKPHPAPPEREAPESPVAQFQSETLADVPAAADQIALAQAGVITLHVTLPDHPPTSLASASSGLYQAIEPDHPIGEPQTGLAAGTLILTARGEVAVETLEPGDLALGLRGPALLPIQWVGRSSAIKPGVQIAAGALGRDMPRRPLRLAADHPVYVQPTAVPARSLVNGSTIQAVALEGVELFQVDVGTSEVLFAEGVPLSSDRRTLA